MTKKKTKKKDNIRAKKRPSMVVHEEAELQSQTESSIEAVVNQSFFYTNDKFFDQIDDAEVMKSVLKAYPGMSTENTDSAIKKTLIEMLNDEEYMTQIMTFYKIDIFDFFKILHKTYASIFKGTYLKKLKNNLDGKKYVKARH